MPKPEQVSAATPITESDVRAAIEAAGYPLEVKLFHEFAVNEMDPVLGHRMRVRDDTGSGDPTSREIDLLASVRTSIVGDGQVSAFNVTAVIDAKLLHEPARFVAVVGDQPSEHERRVARSYFFGRPSFRVLLQDEGSYSDCFIGEAGVADALDPLSAGTFCVHWAIVKREQKNQFEAWAKHDEGFQDAIKTVVEAAVWNERSFSQFSLGLGDNATPVPDLRIYCPTIIVGTPTLYMYDVKDGSISQTDWLMLRMNFDVGGHVVNRVVDIVATGGVPGMIARYKAAKELGKATLAQHGNSLRAVVWAQRRRERKSQRPEE
jgi:hypothetical protein